MAEPTGGIQQNLASDTAPLAQQTDVSQTSTQQSDAPKHLYYDSAAQQPVKPPEKKKPKKHTGLKVFVWIIVIAVILILALIISSMIAGFSTVFDMIDWILDPSNTGIPSR